jgi:hypothetical protein
VEALIPRQAVMQFISQNGALPEVRRHPLFRRSHGVCIALFLATFLSLTAPSRAQDPRPSESQVKAAYLFNFSKFVRWNASSERSDSLVICALGRSSFGTVLDATVKGETINGRRVVAREVPTLQEAAGCQVLFVSASEEGHLGAVLAATKRMGALSVSDIPRFAERGGMIAFVKQQERIRFEVNVAPMESAGITVSSELLKVALRVINKNAGGN